MDSYTLKIYPHKFMNDVDNDLFRADSLAHTVSQLVHQMLEGSGVIVKDVSSALGYELEIHNPAVDKTREIVSKILIIFTSVAKRKVWIEFPIQPKRKLTNIDRCFLEDEMQTDAELGYDEFNLDEI